MGKKKKNAREFICEGRFIVQRYLSVNAGGNSQTSMKLVFIHFRPSQSILKSHPIAPPLPKKKKKKKKLIKKKKHTKKKKKKKKKNTQKKPKKKTHKKNQKKKTRRPDQCLNQFGSPGSNRDLHRETVESRTRISLVTG